jgi:plasmid stabilization system protein ParE
MIVRFTRPARSDLHAIETYISRDDPRMARLIVDRIIERAEALGRQPYTGRPSDLIGVRVAVLSRYRYVIFYSVADGEVHILHVRHMSRRAWTGGLT